MKLFFKYPYSILFVFSLVINLVLYCHLGLVEVTDSYRFLDNAQQIQIGKSLDAHDSLYLAYALFLALVLSVGSKSMILFLQILLGILAVLTLYQTIKNFGFKPFVASITCFLYLLFFEISSWNMYLLSESLFCSLICFFLWAMSFYFISKNNKWLIISALFAFLIFWTRPMGFVILVCFWCYIYLEKIHAHLHQLAKISLVLCTLAIFYVLANQMLNQFELVENYATGEVIYNFSKIPDYRGNRFVLLQVPTDLYIPSTGSTLQKAFFFYFKNPIFGLKLMIIKGLYFFTHCKPYYSMCHNMYNLVFLLPAYIGLFLFYIKQPRNALSIFVLTYVCVYLGIIMLTCEDWDGRFFMGVLPLLFCFGTSTIIQRFIRL